MARQKNDGKGRLGGRVKGTPNRTTQTTKEWIQQILDENQEQIREDLKKLQPKDRVNALLGLLPYVVPKQMATQATVAIERLTEDELGDLAGLLLKSIEKNEDTADENG
jgi:hypothetical protein